MRRSNLWAVLAAGFAAAAIASAGQALAGENDDADAEESGNEEGESVAAMPPRSVTLLDGVPTTPSAAPFRDGEVLTFTATWGGITVGDATMKVDTDGTFEGQEAIHLKAIASSGRAFSLFFSIRDAGESWVHPEGLYSLGFISDQKEGSIEDYQKWIMNYDQGNATRYRARRKNGGEVKNSTKDYKLTATHVQDAFSMIYYFRAFDLKVGSKLESDVFVSRKVWKLTVDVLEREKVKVPAGSFECLKVKPSVTLNGKEQKKGQMVIWVTDDERKIPVKIQSDLPLGKINAVLTKYKQGKHEE